MCQCLRVYREQGNEFIDEFEIVEHSFVRELCKKSRVRFIVRDDRRGWELADLASEDRLVAELLVDGRRGLDKLRMSTTAQVLEQGIRLEAEATWPGDVAANDGEVPRPRRATSRQSLDFLLDHFTAGNWSPAAELYLNGLEFPFPEHGFWLQNGVDNLASLSTFLARIDDLLPSDAPVRERHQLLLTGGGVAAAGRWTVMRNECKPTPANRVEVDRTALPRICGTDAPTRLARAWPRGRFDFGPWSTHVRREFPLFVDDRLVQKMVDRVHPARDVDELEWTTELTLLRKDERLIPDPPPPLPFIGRGVVLQQIDPIWLEIRLNGFEPGWDVVHAQDSTPYSGKEGKAGQVTTPEPGVPVWIAWSGRLSDPFFFAVCERCGRPPDFIGFLMPERFDVHAKDTSFSLASFTTKVQGATRLESDGAMSLQGENATLQLAGDEVTSGG